MMRDSATTNTPLPPSVEKAYHTKCIELKRRLKEIEDANFAARIRKRRLDRAIEKLRLERAFLFDKLAKTQKYLPEDSDKDTSPPPSPQERPVRKPRQLAARANGNAASPGADNSVLASSPVATASTAHVADRPPASVNSTMSAAAAAAAARPVQRVDHRCMDEIPESEPFPEINWLPSHTNVIMIRGEPKQPPWTMSDIAPRHHLTPAINEMWPPLEQHKYITSTGYLPYDMHGNPILVRFIGDRGRAIHIFRDDPRWVSPIVGNSRTDDPWINRFDDGPAPLVPDTMPRRPQGPLEGPDAGALPAEGSSVGAADKSMTDKPSSRDGDGGATSGGGRFNLVDSQPD